MCNTNGLAFSIRNLKRNEIEDKKVLEAGAYDVNGSVQSILKSWGPKEYVGVDITEGPGVDVVCDAGDLVEKFGNNRFDTVVSNEMLEHAREWKKVISNLKNVVKPGGVILVTTRSHGFGYHAFPYDFWRYELEDMREIFSDCEILVLEDDAQEPGVLVKVRKPEHFVEKDLSNYKLYSIVANKRVIDISDSSYRTVYYWKTIFKYAIKQWVLNSGKYVYDQM